jgi:hypothetical protein
MLIEELEERIRGHVDREHRELQEGIRARQLGDPVPSVDAMSAEWLTAALRTRWPDATVEDFRVEPVSEGTHHRHRVHLDVTGGDDAPTSLFTKSPPTLEVRMISGITGHARAEGRFFQQIRPELQIEAPECYASWFDRDSAAALHLLEDLVATKGATFCDFETTVTEEMATEQVVLLAQMHGQYLADPRLNEDLGWLVPFDRWFKGGITKLGIDKYHEEAMLQAADLVPDRLMGRRPELWQAALDSLEPHLAGPETFLHSDVHIGNWYQTGEGHMGLCDWQCVARGHWSRDLAYAITAALTIEDRRAWDESLVRTYAQELSAVSGSTVGFDEAWLGYRRQIPHALLMWTPTLCHSDLLPHMQSDETSLAMISRMTTAIDDVDSIAANR